MLRLDLSLQEQTIGDKPRPANKKYIGQLLQVAVRHGLELIQCLRLKQTSSGQWWIEILWNLRTRPEQAQQARQLCDQWHVTAHCSGYGSQSNPLFWKTLVHLIKPLANTVCLCDDPTFPRFFISASNLRTDDWENAYQHIHTIIHQLCHAFNLDPTFMPPLKIALDANTFQNTDRRSFVASLSSDPAICTQFCPVEIYVLPDPPINLLLIGGPGIPSFT